MKQYTHFNSGLLLQQFNGNSDSLKLIITEGLRLIPSYAAQLRSACAERNPDEIQMNAHKIKGGLLSIRGDNAAKIAGEIEKAARDHRTGEALTLFPVFLTELTDVLDEMKEFVSE
jgi:HPt (histidine-containing phosphotransfer) domain-containing protein